MDKKVLIAAFIVFDLIAVSLGAAYFLGVF
jgi:hypothetical protein